MLLVLVNLWGLTQLPTHGERSVKVCWRVGTCLLSPLEPNTARMGKGYMVGWAGMLGTGYFPRL